jgi:hypothetical protein
VDPPIEGETKSKPKANFQKISACQRLRSQKLFSETHRIRFTEIKAGLMDDQTISRQVKHRFQVATQPGSGKASLVVPTEKCLEMDDAATIQAVTKQSAADLVSPSQACTCERDACRTALKWDHTPCWQIAQ